MYVGTTTLAAPKVVGCDLYAMSRAIGQVEAKREDHKGWLKRLRGIFLACTAGSISRVELVWVPR